MPKAHPVIDNEIDLFDVFVIIWNGKWIILATVLILLLGIISYISFTNIGFNAITEIKPMTSSDLNPYQRYNGQILDAAKKEPENPLLIAEKKINSNLGFLTINARRLLDLYLDQLNQRIVFEEGIIKYKLLDKEKFKDENRFNDAVIKFASSIEILPPKKMTPIAEEREYWSIRAKYNNADKWKEFLSYVNSEANNKVKIFLKAQFKKSASIVEENMNYELEDINTEIDNVITDHDIETSDRLFYLHEQAAIARQLGVASNTLESQAYGSENSMIANVQSNTPLTPFYLRGYKAIEKEIDLIKARQSKEAFVVELRPLEKTRRILRQNIIKFQERFTSSFKSTPINQSDGFVAARMAVVATKFEKHKKLMLLLIPMLGGIIASIYVLMSNVIRKKHKN